MLKEVDFLKLIFPELDIMSGVEIIDNKGHKDVFIHTLEVVDNAAKLSDKMQIRLESMMHNEVNIEALTKAVNKLQADVEKLKDKQRSFANGGHQ